MSKEILIDCRELEPPEPMLKVVEALGELDNDNHIIMLHRIMPSPLLSILGQNGCNYAILNDGKNGLAVKIKIYKKQK